MLLKMMEEEEDASKATGHVLCVSVMFGVMWKI